MRPPPMLSKGLLRAHAEVLRSTQGHTDGRNGGPFPLQNGKGDARPTGTPPGPIPRGISSDAEVWPSAVRGLSGGAFTVGVCLQGGSRGLPCRMVKLPQ